MNEVIESIVREWITTRHVSDSDRELLKAQYLIDINAPAGCKPCASVWSDIRQHFFYQFKQVDPSTYKMATTLRKYMILGLGMLMLPGESTAIVNDGETNENTKVLTDKMAEEILEQYPSYESLIGINPAWQAAEDAKNAPADEETSDEGDDDGEKDTLIESLKKQLEESQTNLAESETNLAATKRELTTTKSQLTKARNEIAELKEAATMPTSTDPAASTDASTPTDSTESAGDGTASTPNA